MELNDDIEGVDLGYTARELTPYEQSIEKAWNNDRGAVLDHLKRWVSKLIYGVDDRSGPAVQGVVDMVAEHLPAFYKRQLPPFAAVEEIRQLLIEEGWMDDFD